MPFFAMTLLVTGPPDEVELAARQHRDHLRQLHERGKLRAAGEFCNGDGFLEIYDTEDLHEAEALARSSPLVFEGLATWMLREWVELELDSR